MNEQRALAGLEIPLGVGHGSVQIVFQLKYLCIVTVSIGLYSIVAPLHGNERVDTCPTEACTQTTGA